MIYYIWIYIYIYIYIYIKNVNKKMYCIKCKSKGNWETIKYHTFSIKHYFLCGSKYDIIFKKEESIETLKMFLLINNIDE